jgi:hypothetical protein
MRLRMVGLVAVGLMVAGCGDQTTGLDPGLAAEPPLPQSGAPDGAVTTRHPVTVLDSGDGAELCLGGVQDSLPPQCGGPELVGWGWAGHDGYYQNVGGVRWGEFKVTGTFDGTDITVTDVVPAVEWTGSGVASDVDFSSPCPEPPDGWPSEPMLMFSYDAVFEAAQRRSDYAGGWVTQRNPRDPGELDQPLADDPEAKILPPIVNIKVAGDPAAAEAELTKVWDGPLCVTTAKRTESELRAIQDEVTTSASGMLSASVDIMTGTVQLTVAYDDGTLQAELDERYGEGVVDVESALIPAE